ncbi:MAG: hypothetical protein QOF77_1994 [Solirubrobacteraceae bacterium]|jgi:hypothetical protein|nr:hypothetical protein [Solirubrobacteraceae bacterium]
MDADTPSEPLLSLAERRRQERRAVEEAGGGEAEGFELAEQDLIDHASHADDRSSTSILTQAGREEEPSEASYAEADEERKPD